jgi:hypothetical protein
MYQINVKIFVPRKRSFTALTTNRHSCKTCDTRPQNKDIIQTLRLSITGYRHISDTVNSVKQFVLTSTTQSTLTTRVN